MKSRKQSECVGQRIFAIIRGNAATIPRGLPPTFDPKHGDRGLTQKLRARLACNRSSLLGEGLNRRLNAQERRNAKPMRCTQCDTPGAEETLPHLVNHCNAPDIAAWRARWLPRLRAAVERVRSSLRDSQSRALVAARALSAQRILYLLYRGCPLILSKDVIGSRDLHYIMRVTGRYINKLHEIRPLIEPMARDD